jgi:hypothetical protein
MECGDTPYVECAEPHRCQSLGPAPSSQASGAQVVLQPSDRVRDGSAVAQGETR